MTRRRWWPVFIALGSNLDDPWRHLEQAVRDIHALPHTAVYRVSDVVRSAPLDGSDQPDYLNAVLGALTQATPHALLDGLQGIERAHGRRRDRPRWSARPLDLDIVAYADLQLADDRLELPHPGAAQRAFVVGPLAQMAPHVSLPGVGRVAQLAADADIASLVSVGRLVACAG